MLSKLGDFSVKRNFVGALLFYIIYGAVGVFLCGMITSMIVQANSSDSSNIKTLAMTIAPVIAGVYTLIIAISMILSKHLLKDALAILCAVVGALASTSLGLVFGFIPIAVLSSFNNIENKN